jgi:hypothetical protein
MVFCYKRGGFIANNEQGNLRLIMRVSEVHDVGALRLLDIKILEKSVQGSDARRCATP